MWPAKLPAYLPPLHPSSDYIEDENRKRDITQLIQKLWQLERPVTHCPCPNPVSITRRDLGMLKTRAYIPGPKGDGNRFLLLMGRYGGDQHLPFSAMIDRRMRMFSVPVIAAESFFDGTLIDGELVWEYHPPTEKPRMTFLSFDLIALQGESMVRRPYIERLQALQRHISLPDDQDIMHDPDKWNETMDKLAEEWKIVCVGNEYCMRFALKKFVDIKSLSSLWSMRSNLLYACDGIVLTPNDDPVRVGTHRHMFKVKIHHTIDLKLVYRGGEVKWLWFDERLKQDRECEGTMQVQGVNAPCVLWCNSDHPIIHQWITTQKRKGRANPHIIVELVIRFDEPCSSSSSSPSSSSLSLSPTLAPPAPSPQTVAPAYTFDFMGSGFEWTSDASLLDPAPVPPVPLTSVPPASPLLPLKVMAEPMRLRFDKSHCNTRSTVISTIQNLAENVTVEEIIQMVESDPLKFPSCIIQSGTGR